VDGFPQNFQDIGKLGKTKQHNLRKIAEIIKQSTTTVTAKLSLDASNICEGFYKS
jgi:hypothetical protein